MPEYSIFLSVARRTSSGYVALLGESSIPRECSVTAEGRERTASLGAGYRCSTG